MNVLPPQRPATTATANVMAPHAARGRSQSSTSRLSASTSAAASMPAYPRTRTRTPSARPVSRAATASGTHPLVSSTMDDTDLVDGGTAVPSSGAHGGVDIAIRLLWPCILLSGRSCEHTVCKLFSNIDRWILTNALFSLDNATTCAS